MLEHFFSPESVAVVGASREPGKVGHDVLKNLQDAGFDGPIYPINPKADEIEGLKCYSDLPSVGDQIDLAIIVLPARIVLSIVDQCVEAGVDSIIVISAGFKEVGEEGAEMERKLQEKCNRHNIRCIGPNCLGLISAPDDLNASFSATYPEAGNVGFLSQSGAFGTAMLDWLVSDLAQGLGISRFISYGNKADVDETDLIEALGQDDETDVILGYIESIDDGQKFMKVVREVTRKKPVIILKSGRTDAGARAASSHTGSLAGSDRAYDAAFHQCGVIRPRTVDEFFDCVLSFARQKAPEGPSVGVVTNAGGPGIMSTDAIETSSLRMSSFSDPTIEAMRDALPPEASMANPIDVIGDARADRYEAAIGAALRDEDVDSLLVIITPQTSTEIEETARVIGQAASGTDKPVLASFMGGGSAEKGSRALREFDVPSYNHPDTAVAVLDAMWRYRRGTGETTEIDHEFDFNHAQINKALQEAADSGVEELGERRAQNIIRHAGIRLPRTEFAETAEAAARAASDIGYPVVMKVCSNDILHKSDAGGVEVGLEDRDQIREAFDRIMESAREYDPDADVDGVLVEETITGGTEVIVGMNRDPQFGPLIMFGLGGIYVEVLEDVAFRVAPLTRKNAHEMIDEIRSGAILKGFRGEEPRDLDALADAILRLSHLSLLYPQLAECDMNPLLVFPEGKGVAALDVRFRLEHDGE
ncbi:MAG: acetate--CoA ligase alpha subunit [Candidatus Brocadiia bacterium]